MSEAPRFWSPAFIEAFVDRLNRDPGFRDRAGRFSDTIVMQCLDTPGGRDVRATYAFDRGHASVEIVDGAAPSPVIRDEPFDPRGAMARATAPYDIWRRLDDGSLGIMDAMSLPEYRIEGPRLKIMLNLAIFDALARVASGTPKRY